MRILIAGGAGFIGSHLVDHFRERGDDVVIVDSLATGRIANIAHHLGPKCELMMRDVSERFQVDGNLDWVLHFASPASPLKYQAMPVTTLRANADGTFRLLELAQSKNAQFLLASTSEVYGDALVHPQTEAYWGNVNPIGPRSCYDEAKRYAEAMTVAFSQTCGLPVRIVRIFNTYGPHMDWHDGRVIPNLLKQAIEGKPLTIYGDGKQTRSFQYISDLVHGIMLLMASDYQQPVNLGNPEEVSVLQAANIICRLLNRSPDFAFRPLPEDDPQQRQPDISLAKRLLAWRPLVSLEDGLVQMLWKMENGQPHF